MLEVAIVGIVVIVGAVAFCVYDPAGFGIVLAGALLLSFVASPADFVLKAMKKRAEQVEAEAKKIDAERTARNRRGNYTDNELKAAMDATVEAHRRQRT
jgi:hypothetical protein